MPVLLMIFVLALRLYMLLIFISVLGSWFPQWRRESWYRFIDDIVSPYLNLFRGLNLRYGMIDFSALVAIILLQIFEHIVISIVGQGGMRIWP